MLKKQQLKLFQQGHIKCSSCSCILHCDDYDGLEVVCCPECNAPVFIPLKIKNYFLYRPLGGGGIGSVYKAIDESTLEDLAIKVLPRQHKNSASMKDALLREGEMGSIIGIAPNIVDVTDYGEENEETFIAFRYISGTRLDIFVSSLENLSEKMALDILLQIIEAELHILNCGFLYRDIKPENIIIVEQTATAKLLDFGLTLPLSQAQNPGETDLIEGSPYYLPPERIVSAPEGEHSEVYSLGMLLFFMVAGTTYFTKSDIKHIIGKHVRSVRVATVSNRLKLCSDEFCKLIDKMIKRNPNERFHNLTELKNTAQEILKDAQGYTLQQNRKSILAGKASSILTGGIAGRDTKKTLRDHILTAIVIICFILIGIISIRVMYNKYQAKQRQAIKAEIARQFNIPPNISPPEKSIAEVEKIVKMNYNDIIKEFNEKYPKFNTKLAEEAIAKQYGFDPNSIKNPQVPKGNFDNLITKYINTKIKEEISKRIKNISKESLRKKLASELGIKLPCNPPTKSIENIYQLLKQEAENKAIQRFSQKNEKQALLKKLKSLKMYEEGEIITIKDKNSTEITGIFKGRIGNNIMIASNKIPLSSLSYDTQVKFDKTLCATERKSASEMIHNEFLRKRENFIEQYQKQNEFEIFKKYGYLKKPNNVLEKWHSAYEILESKLKNKIQYNTKNKLSILKSVKKKINADFNKEQFLRDSGFVKYKGKWISQKKFTDLLVANKKKEYDQDIAEKLKELKKEFKKTEKEIYFENSYLKTANGWYPANQVLEDELTKIFH
jgi:serine/threonine-protein kinase